MKLLLEFLTTKKVAQSEVFPHLKCSEDEAKILQNILNKYVGGREDVYAIDVLSELFGEKDFAYLHHLQEVKTLLELGWLHHQSFNPVKVADVTPLELLNTAISPTPSLFKLLQEGSFEIELPEIKPYSDHLEYLQDQFYRIELHQKMSAIRQNVHEHSLGIDRLHNKLELLEENIAKRVESTQEKDSLILDTFFKQKKLTDKEQVIFIALLREEYSATDASLREMNNLIELISFDEYERIKNRGLLEEGSRLITEGIIDYEEMLNPFGGISRAFYIVDEVLQNIIHPQKNKKVRRLKLSALVEEQDVFELIEPNSSLEDVVLNPQTQKTLQNLLKQVDKEVINRLVSWGIKEKKSGIDARIIFYGPPGTGKTLTAHSLAKSLKKQILSFDCSKILSMYVGESEKNVRKIFDTYYDLAKKTKSEPILLLNEADQFLSSRSSGITSGADQMHNQMQNIFLEQIESFEGMLIATTNLLENIDKAFSRRFNYKIEFKKPNYEQRIQLWQLLLPEEADFEAEFAIEKLAKYDLTGGQINLIVKNTAYKVAVREEAVFTMEDFVEEIKKEQSGDFAGEKSMGFLHV